MARCRGKTRSVRVSRRGGRVSAPAVAPDSIVGVCLLCKLVMTADDSVCVKKGLPRLIESSRERRNADHERAFEQVTEIRLHIKCRMRYICKSTIKAQLNRLAREEGEGPIDEGVRLRSAPDTTYDPKAHCLFCGKVIDFDNLEKQPHSVRNSIQKRAHRVETFEMKKSVDDAIKDRKKELGDLDSWAVQVDSRMASVVGDFCAAEVRYHALCDLHFATMRDLSEVSNPRGRPVGTSPEIDSMFQQLCEFLDNNEEYQFSMGEIEAQVRKQNGGAMPCSRKWLKALLLGHYEDNIRVTECPGRENVLNFSGFVDQLLQDNWYTERRECPWEERKRVVALAAKFVAEEVRMTYHNMGQYPSGKLADESLPPLLSFFLETLITTKADDKAPVERKRKYIGQCLVLAMRPSSYISPILLSLGAVLHGVLESRWLIDVLSALGASHSYKEIKTFRYSLTQDAKRRAEEEEDTAGFKQWGFDNADFQTATLDGKNTFHRLGGAEIVTPARALPPVNVPRLKLPSTAEDMASRGHFIPLEKYHKPAVNGLSRLAVRPATLASAAAARSIKKAHVLDTLYLWGLCAGLPSTPSWSGFMKKAMKCDGAMCYTYSSVQPTPFVDHDPTDATTIYSAVLFIAKECERKNQDGCLVTFDNGLYPKAAEIVASDQQLKKVVPRLGGFHFLMSFMGAVGYIMGGSGLDDLWREIYAANSTVWMMAGKAFARALRAHFLTQEALGVLLLRADTDLSDDTKEELCSLHTAFLENIATPTDAAEAEAAQSLWTSLQAAGERAAARSRTGRLWWQYYRLVAMMHDFIRAERTGEWELHLAATVAMEPVFAAAHHHNYTKSTRLYIQTMEGLDGALAEAVQQGYFTVRRSASYWGGVWTDMVVEQDVMRKFKSRGGVTRRGMTESVLSQWIGSMPALHGVSADLEEFCGVRSVSSEQHVQLRDSRVKRDHKDRAALLAYLESHNPFDTSDGIRCISTGVLGDSTVNCDHAEEAGATALQKIVGTTFDQLKISQKDRVIPLSHQALPCKKKADNTSESSALFVSMCCAGVSPAQFREYCKYELCRAPPALFDGGMMRHNNKSDLTERFLVQPPSESRCAASEVTVIDGGYLMHVVAWPGPGKRGEKRSTWKDVCMRYVGHIDRLYRAHGPVKVVFDGYGVRWSTKCEEQRRRTENMGAKISPDIEINEDFPMCDVQREQFLANVKNKTALIELLITFLEKANVEVIKAEADADVLIVETALAHGTSPCHVRVIATDTDVLAILIARVREEHISVVHPATKTTREKLWDIGAIRAALGGMTECTLAVHALTGCDTTAAIYNKGKLKLWDIVAAEPALQDAARVFNEPDVENEKLAECAEKLMLALYSKGTTAKSLDELRYYTFNEMATDPKKRHKLLSTHLRAMPFTSNACRMKALRSYLQVQQWLGVDLSPMDYGWAGKDLTLVPIPTTLPYAPEDLLQAVSCGCKTGCKENSNCSCRKNKSPCSAACKNCRGREEHGCTNTIEGGEDLEDFV